MHVPSTPAIVNVNFPATLPAATPFALRCAMPDVPVVLRTADDQSTLHLPVRGHLQVVLPANPSTGYAWRIEPELPTSVLAPLGDPTFRPASSADGAGGTITLDFFANGPGLVELHLVYDRTFASAPPLHEWTVTVIVSGQQTIAWLGEVRSQPAAPPTARYLELRVPALEEGAVPSGAGIAGSDGASSNAIEAYTNTGTDVLVWGELTCGLVDYGNCRIDATSILLTTAESSRDPYPVVGWRGTVGTLPDGTADYFQLAGHFPVQYGITGVDFDLEAQLTEVGTNGTRIRIWGELHAPADDTNRVRIVVTKLAVAP